jgi:hypothetical protein
MREAEFNLAKNVYHRKKLYYSYTLDRYKHYNKTCTEILYRYTAAPCPEYQGLSIATGV